MNGPVWEDSFSGRARLGGIVVRPQSTTVPISHYTNWIVPLRWRKYFPSNQDGMQIEGQELKATFIHCRRYKWIKDLKTPRTIKEKISPSNGKSLQGGKPRASANTSVLSLCKAPLLFSSLLPDSFLSVSKALLTSLCNHYLCRNPGGKETSTSVLKSSFRSDYFCAIKINQLHAFLSTTHI